MTISTEEILDALRQAMEPKDTEEGWFTVTELCEVMRAGRKRVSLTLARMIKAGEVRFTTQQRQSMDGVWRWVPVYQLQPNHDAKPEAPPD